MRKADDHFASRYTIYCSHRRRRNMMKNNREYVIIANLSTNHEGNVTLANKMIEEACVRLIIILYYYNVEKKM